MTITHYPKGQRNNPYCKSRRGEQVAKNKYTVLMTMMIITIIGSDSKVSCKYAKTIRM